jgi:cytochrome c biogenesis protein CcmG, thiol:disulfide interchange protein DsbE
MKRAFVVLATLLAVTLAATLSPPPAHSAEAAVAADRAKVPSFRLKDLKGKKVRIEDLKGKVVMISFWATWCVPCKRELDDLAKLYKKHHGAGLEVLAIATDGPETYSAIRGVVKRHRWPFRILPDKEGEATSILNPRGTVPYSMYVDRQGRLAYDHEGYGQGDAEKMAKHIKELLAEPAP